MSEADESKPAPDAASGATGEASPATPPGESTAATAAPVTAAPAKPRWRGTLKMAALGGALAGMVFGAVIEMFVQGAMESTGWFGPTLDTVIHDQMTNFEAIQAKLEALEKAGTEAERVQLTAELGTLLKEQKQLTTVTHDELRQAHEQLQALREQTLQEQGVAGGVDFWLSPGQSVSVGSRGNVFAVNRVLSTGTVSATLSGESHALKPGDFVEATANGETYKVFYRMGPTASDRHRVGFDLVRPGE